MPTSLLRRYMTRVAPIQDSSLAAPWRRYFPVWSQGATDGNGVTFTMGGSNALGAWVELFASTSEDIDAILLWIRLTNNGNVADSALLSISTGTAGNEAASVIVKEAQVGGIEAHCSIMFPIHVLKGSRISIAAQCEYATPQASSCVCQLYKLPFTPSASYLTSYGSVTATSRGQPVTTNNTWTTVIASTTEPYQGLLFTHGPNGQTYQDSTVGTTQYGIGGAGVEVEIGRAARRPQYHGSSNVWVQANWFIVGSHIPAGTRVAVRDDQTTNNDLDIVTFGIPYA